MTYPPKHLSRWTMPAACRAPAVYHFAGELAGTNPNFDRARFIAACLEG